MDYFQCSQAIDGRGQFERSEAGDVPGHIRSEDVEASVVDIAYHPVYDLLQRSLSIHVSDGIVQGVTDTTGLGDVDDLIHISDVDERPSEQNLIYSGG